MPGLTPIVLVTGAGRGIGRAAAVALGDAGAAVCINDINPDSAAETAARIVSAGGSARVYLADISKKFPVQGLFNEIEDDWERVHAVVHCARVTPRRPLLEMDEWEWRRTLDVDLTGAFNVIQIAGRLMETTGGGVIVLMLETPEDMTHLGAVEAARRGVLALAETAQAELAGAGIRVEVVEYKEGERETAVRKVIELITNLRKV
jgi:3-oxoacyl-[acyl-carrier protein] reductase